MGAALLVALACLGAACTSKDDSGGEADAADVTTTTVDTTAVLGERNEATDSPITVGVIDDGASDAIDNSTLGDGLEATIAYANDFLGGINGHRIEVERCETGQTPAGGSSCAAQMIDAGVAAVLIGLSGQDGAVTAGLEGSGIPLFISSTGTPEILLGENTFALSNPLAGFTATAQIAQEEGIERAAYVVIDVPAASGAVASVAQPIFEDAGITLDLINVSPQVADMTPQIQQALGSGAEMFNLVGTEEFTTSALRALRQAQFDGPITTVLGEATPEAAASVDGGYEGVIAFQSGTADPEDPDVALFNAVLDEYTDLEDDGLASVGFVTALAFVRALDGHDDAVDAESISAVLEDMAEPLPLPMGAGITFQCGSPPSPTVPRVCSTDILRTSLDAEGQPTEFEFVDVAAMSAG